MKNAFLLLLILFSKVSAQAQSERSEQSLYSLLVAKYAFVVSRPITRSDFKDRWPTFDDTVRYADNRFGYRAFEAAGIGTRRLAELVINCQRIDTAAWTTQELGLVILIASRADYVNSSQALIQLGITAKEEIKIYRRSIRLFNNTSPEDRQIYKLSRPVFDNEGRYAAVIEDSGYHGGGSLIIFEKKAAGWQEVGRPKRWVY